MLCYQHLSPKRPGYWLLERRSTQGHEISRRVVETTKESFRKAFEVSIAVMVCDQTTNFCHVIRD